MLIGEYLHTLDDKKRLLIPSKFRNQLGRTVIVSRGLDGCLFIHSESEWLILVEKLSHMPLGAQDSRAFSRFMLSGAVDVDIDSSGRILLPDYLKSFAKLENKVFLVGVMSRIEVWSEAEWQTYSRRVEGDSIGLAEKLSTLGII
jgi:MraZ protein